MKQKTIKKTIFLGFLSWLLPFAFSFLFYNSEGELIVAYSTFKTIITVFGVITGSFLLYHYFRFVENNFIKNGILVGLSWFIINILLDSFILIPIMKTTFSDYFLSIGLSYIAIPAISVTMGYLLERNEVMKVKFNNN